MAESSSDSDPASPTYHEIQMDYESELQKMRDIVDSGNKASSELVENLKFIRLHTEKEKQMGLENPGPPTKYIPLHHSKHREFLDSTMKVVEFLRDYEKIAEVHKENSYPRLKAELQNLSLEIKSNRMEIRYIEDMISELQASHQSVNQLVNNCCSSNSKSV